MTAAAKWWKCNRPKWKLNRIYSMNEFDVPDIKWVERYIVGITHPATSLSQPEIDRQLEVVNRALRHGKIVAVEQNFTILTSEGKDIITQYTVYHVGFKHRPSGK